MNKLSFIYPLYDINANFVILQVSETRKYDGLIEELLRSFVVVSSIMNFALILICDI